MKTHFAAKTNGSKKLTGLQMQFVYKYLGEALFDATCASELAGYKATSKHSFQQIGYENLRKPHIRAVIDEHFRMTRMTSDEVLTELCKLARGESRDKIKALALLSQHHGLLDGSGREEIVPLAQKEGAALEAYYNLKVASAIEKVYGDWRYQVKQFNKEADERYELIQNQWRVVTERYKQFPAAVEALALLHDAIHGKVKLEELETETATDLKTEQEAIEPDEVIPPERRLQPAAVERMMRETEAQSETDQEYITTVWMGQTIRVKKETTY